MNKKFYAQKDALGFPIVGTMMSGASVPNQKNLIEIKAGLGLGTHPQKFKYYVRKDKTGNILPNSLFTSFAAQDPGKTINLHLAANGCIQFVADTSLYNQFNFGMSVYVTGTVKYTATWGDGTTTTGTIDADTNADIEHYFNDGGEYTVQLCFSDPTKVENLNFWAAD